MANVELSLSSKSREDGKRQILVRISSGRSIRFRYKSGVYVTPCFWNDADQSIKVPVGRKTNKASVETARAERAALESFIADLDNIIGAANDTPGATLSAEWIDHCFALRPILEDTRNGFFASMTNGLFTAPNIERANKLMGELKASETKAAGQEQSKTLYDLALDYCRARNLSHSRTKTYKVLARMLARFELFVRLTDRKRKDYSLVVSKVCSEDIESFRDFARNEGSLQQEYPKVFQQILSRYPQTENPRFPNRTIQDKGANYIVTIMKALKAVCGWCRETGRTDIDAFRGVEIGAESYGEPYYITKEERDLIANFDLSDQPTILQQQRDIFVFQCLVGCRVSDLYSFTPDNIQNAMLRYRPKKTESETAIVARVPLTERALDLLKKYDGVDSQGRIFPFIATQHYNDYIKRIFAICGVTRNVIWRNPATGKSEVRPINEVASSHLARRCFVGNIYRKVQDPSVIGAMSGHAPGSRAFARYRNISDDILVEVMGLND